MSQRTPLHVVHVALGGRMVDFGGWEMPIQYQSVLEEHHAVRRHAGVFDVSHMTFLEVTGGQARAWLRHLLANDVDRLSLPGQAMYSAMLNEQAGILDDLIVYAPLPEQPELWRVVVNCGTHDKDLEWMQHQSQGWDVQIVERQDLAMLAVQGPKAREILGSLWSAEMNESLHGLAVFQGGLIGGMFVGRTGYTGEDGVEVMLPGDAAVELFNRLVDAGVRACGLGARDTLRLEAGMNLYGSDMSEQDTPLTSNMAWTVRWDHDFIGSATLKAEKEQGAAFALTGLVLRDRGVLRAHMKVDMGDGRQGEITSGTFSPTLQTSIALARLPQPLPSSVEIDLRGRRVRADVVRPPFVRHGKACF